MSHTKFDLLMKGVSHADEYIFVCYTQTYTKSIQPLAINVLFKSLLLFTTQT